MATTIKLKNSVTATNAPSSLVQGEVAINVTDKKVWVGNAATTPIQLLGGGADGSFTNISVSSVATFGAGTVSLPAITTTGDTNTGIFFPAADTIAFTEGGVESMRIDSSGNVLIGTSSGFGSGTYGLRVSNTAVNGFGTLSLQGNRTVAEDTIGLVQAFNSSTEVTRIGSIQGTNATSGQIVFSTASTGTLAEKMRITAAGDVGIGTSTFASGSRLAVQTTAGKFDVAAFGGGSIQLISNGAFGFNSNSSFLFSTGASDWMGLDNTGRLSIGTTSAPSTFPSPLNVTATSAGAAAITIVGRASDGNGTLYFNNSSGATNQAYIVSSSTNFEQFNTTTTGAFVFGTNSAERMRIDSSGNLLVAITATQNISGITTDHTFAGTTSTNRWVCGFINSSASSPYGLAVSYTGNAPNATGNQFLFCRDTGGTRFEVRSNGGIANYSANDVNLSDEREKTNIQLAGSYLDKICAIPVKTFNYIDQNLKEDGGLTLGVIAQDVQAVAPELVMESNWAAKDEPEKMRLSIYQTDLQYALMKCIQEQQAMIQELKAELDSVKAELQTLKGN